MLMIKRRFEWDMGHRVLGHQGKCRFPHGHRYACEVWLAGELDDLGMVMDYGEIKAKIGGWLDEHLDHSFVLYEQDDELRMAMASLTDQKAIVLGFNPTAENLAPWLLKVFQGFVPQVCGITLWETPNCSVVCGETGK